jgi:hypothetical protein
MSSISREVIKYALYVLFYTCSNMKHTYNVNALQFIFVVRSLI